MASTRKLRGGVGYVPSRNRVHNELEKMRENGTLARHFYNASHLIPIEGGKQKRKRNRTRKGKARV
jgi:hypothetical protein